MGRLIAKAEQLFHGNKRQMLTAAAALFAVYVLLLTGIFSYFHSEDRVTNRLTGKSGSVLLKEPKWDEAGQQMARASEPGMLIPKNPSGFNNGKTDEYIRLKMTVELPAFQTSGKTEAYLNAYNTDANQARRLRSIIEALRMENGDPFLTLDTTGDVSAWQITACGNPEFRFKAGNASDSDEKLVFYFYYTGSTGGTPNDVLSEVSPDGSTADLFDHLEIPVYKADYLGVFDQEYNIVLEAQGINSAPYATDYPDGLPFAQAPAEFE